MSAWGVVVAAGSGSRFGSAKQHVLLRGKPLWEWARDALLGGGCEHVVVVGEVPGGVAGGDRRRDSVGAGLGAVPSGVDWVLVHDAARPLASASLASRVLDRLVVGDCDGAVPVVPVGDTIKEVESGIVVGTVERSGLVAVQTPQGFPLEMLRRAHAATEEDASDDAVLIERVGGRVAVVEGEVFNLKVTHAEDLQLAEALLP